MVAILATTRTHTPLVSFSRQYFTVKTFVNLPSVQKNTFANSLSLSIFLFSFSSQCASSIPVFPFQLDSQNRYKTAIQCKHFLPLKCCSPGFNCVVGRLPASMCTLISWSGCQVIGQIYPSNQTAKRVIVSERNVSDLLPLINECDSHLSPHCALTKWTAKQ